MKRSHDHVEAAVPSDATEPEKASRLALLYGPGNEDANRIWAAVLLIFLAFFFYQFDLEKQGVQGYRPFQSHVTHTNYLYRSALSLFLFFGPLLFLAAPFLRRLALGALCVATLAFHGIILSAAQPYVVDNDRAEALSVAIQRCLHGEFPYLPSQACGPITPLTTNLLIAAPSELLFHRPELMTPFLLISGFLVLMWYRKRIGSTFPAELLAPAIFLNPVAIWELNWASDAMWGGILLGATLVFLDLQRVRTAAILFGLSMCTRSSFILLAPLWALFFWQREKRTWAPWIIVGSIVAVLELPMFLWNPNVFLHYAPLGMSKILLSFPAPPHDSIPGDVVNALFPAGPGRSMFITVALLMASALLGLLVRGTRQLALGTCALFGLMYCCLGKFFLIDYLSTLLFPLLFVAMGTSQKTPEIHSNLQA